jgi:hypothetical protein
MPTKAGKLAKEFFQKFSLEFDSLGTLSTAHAGHLFGLALTSDEEESGRLNASVLKISITGDSPLQCDCNFQMYSCHAHRVSHH